MLLASDAAIPDGAIAVVFSSRMADDAEGYAAMAERMLALAAEQPGYLGARSLRDTASGEGITVSYWRDEEAARRWKQVGEHLAAQREGRRRWYAAYRVEVCRLLRSYGG